MTAPSTHPVDFEPSLIDTRLYASRRRYTRIDVANIICVMIGLLYLLPAHLIVPNLTYAGRPALIVALLLCAWWTLAHLSPRLVMPGPQPMRWAAAGYMLAVLLAYIAGLKRGLPALESNGEDFAVLATLELIGVVLMVADGVPNWERLKGILRFFTWCSVFMAVVGAIQSLLGLDLTRYLVVPGLQLKGDLSDFQGRGDTGLFRVAGTATHYIEFSTVLAMALPVALHFSRYAETKRKRRIYLAVSILLAGTVPLAISRTGVLALFVALAVMFPIWDWRYRYNLLGVTAVVMAVLAVARPGLLGTLKSMFINANSADDNSIAGRTEDYAYVEHWFNQRPWFGRGVGTLIPAAYNGFTLDNQWLGHLVTMGIVGVVAFAGLFICAIWLAGLALRRSQRADEKHLCLVLIAEMIIAIVVSGTFDSLAFTTFSTTMALFMGCCGAVWRFTHPLRTVRTSSVRRLGV